MRERKREKQRKIAAIFSPSRTTAEVKIPRAEGRYWVCSAESVAGAKRINQVKTSALMKSVSPQTKRLSGLE